jgi:hypothetical protein
MGLMWITPFWLLVWSFGAQCRNPVQNSEWPPVVFVFHFKNIYYLFLWYWGLNLRPTPWATPPVFFFSVCVCVCVLGIFKIGSCKLFAWLASNKNPPDLYLLRCEPPVPSYNFYLITCVLHFLSCQKPYFCHWYFILIWYLFIQSFI